MPPGGHVGFIKLVSSDESDSLKATFVLAGPQNVKRDALTCQVKDGEHHVRPVIRRF